MHLYTPIHMHHNARRMIDSSKVKIPSPSPSSPPAKGGEKQTFDEGIKDEMCLKKLAPVRMNASIQRKGESF
jgi:hypothetical protein